MDAEFRVIDPDTGKPRAKGTEDWTDQEYRVWKSLPWWRKRKTVITFPRIGWLTVLLAIAAAAAALVRS